MRDPPNAKNNNVNEVKNLEIMGVQEMDAMEMRNENGGWMFVWYEMWGGGKFY